MNRTLQTDWIHFEATIDTLEIHRRHGNDAYKTSAVNRKTIRRGILNTGYERLKNYQQYAPIKNGKEKFARILIRHTSI